MEGLISVQEHGLFGSVCCCPDNTTTACRYGYRTHCDSA